MTGLRTGVNILFLAWVARAVAGNVSHALDNVGCIDTENCGNVFCRAVTAGDAKAGAFFLTLGKRLGVRVTARIAARAAVCAGQALSYGCEFFVLLNREELRCQGKEHRASYCGYKKNEYGN